MKSRIALAMLLVFAAALVGSGTAQAVETPTITIDKMLETTLPAYYQTGDPITYLYEVGGNDRFINVVVTDDTCSPVNAVLETDILKPNFGFNVGDTVLPYGALNGLANEVWEYTCTTDAPAGAGATLTNTGHVEAISPTPGWDQFQGITWEDDDTYTLYGFTLRKDVGLYNDGNYPDFGFSDTTPFTVEVYNDPTAPFDSFVKVDGNLTIQEPTSGGEVHLWVTPGAWKFLEVNLPQGYAPVDWYKDGIVWETGLTPANNDWAYLNVTRSGCSLGHWKNSDVWPYPYTHDSLLNGPFTPIPVAGDTFIEALNYGGGPGVQGGQMILLRQAVAALLNEELYGTAFGPYLSTAELITAVNLALASGNKTTMTTLAGTLDWWNNGICREGTSTSTACPTIAGSFNTNFELTRPPEICEIPAAVIIYGDITAPDILLKVAGEVHGNITQTGFNGLWILAGGSVYGDLNEYGGQLVDIAGTVNGDVTEHDQGALNVQAGGIINGNATEYGDGDLHIFSGGSVTGTVSENGNGSLIIDP